MAKASDNVFPYVQLAPAAAPSSPSAGSERLYLDSGDSNKLKRKNSSGTVTAIEGSGGGGGSTVVPYFAATSGAGDIAMGSVTSYADITGLSLSVAAVAGDKILITANVSLYNDAGADPDVTISVAGTSKSTNGYANNGTNHPSPVSVQWLHTVISGDISGGNVAIKARARAGSGNTFIYNNATHGITATLSAVNYGH